MLRQAAALSHGGAKVGQAVIERETGTWPSFQAHMCRSLKKRGMATASCAA